MEIFPDRLVSDIAGVTGAGHSFLRQICAPDGADLRGRLQQLAARLGPPLDTRAGELLASFDNRRFFQGFAELVTVGVLQDAGWRVRVLHTPGPRIEMRSPAGTGVMLSVLAFLHQTRPGGEEETRARLVDALSRVRARDRFMVLIRRWLPHDFDPAPVRRAVEMWLARVARNEWEGRYAAYEDEHVALEFALTRQRVKGQQSPLADVMGPFFAHRTLEAVEPRVVQEVDRHRAGPLRNRPLLVALVADQPWLLTDGYVRDFLYGRPSLTASGEHGPRVEFNDQSSVSLFRDPLSRDVAGVMFVDRDPFQPVQVRAEALLNPWARDALDAHALACRTFAPALDDEPPGGRGPGVVRMHWHRPLARAWDIG